MPTTIAVVDDHHLVAHSFSEFIRKYNGYEVLFTAEHGRELITHLEKNQIPDIVLLDLHMPLMDGFETAQYLQQHYPDVKIIVLSMFDRDEDVTKMLRLGARGYLPKGCRPAEFRLALDDVSTKGHHYSEFVANKLAQNFIPGKSNSNGGIPQINDRELAFLKLAGTDLTYTEIADIMCVAPRTVDGYRESLFQKLDVKSRTGMVLEALRLGLIDLRDIRRR